MTSCVHKWKKTERRVFKEHLLKRRLFATDCFFFFHSQKRVTHSLPPSHSSSVCVCVRALVRSGVFVWQWCAEIGHQKCGHCLFSVLHLYLFVEPTCWTRLVVLRLYLLAICGDRAPHKCSAFRSTLCSCSPVCVCVMETTKMAACQPPGC